MTESERSPAEQPPVTPERVLRLVRSVFGARDHEIVCSEFFERLPRYVDLAIASETDPRLGADPPDVVMREVAHHIAQCPECAESYHVLLEVARPPR